MSFEGTRQYNKANESELEKEVVLGEEINVTEQYEIDFSNPEDWALFLESIEDVYADAMFYEEVAKVENYQSLTIEDIDGKEIFNILFQKLQMIVNEINEAKENSLKGEAMADEKIDQIQILYDELILLCDHVINTYKAITFIQDDANYDYEESDNPHRYSSKMMIASSENEEINVVPIVFTSQVNQVVEPISVTEKIPKFSPAFTKRRELTSSVIDALEERDYINVAVANEYPEVFTPNEVHNHKSLTDKYLTDGRYQDYIRKYYSSSQGFEKIIYSVVAQIESHTIDSIERWLGEKPISVFAFLQGLTIDEVMRLGSTRNTRQILSENKIKYESFVEWFELLNTMLLIIEADQTMTFGELFAKWVIEIEILNKNNRT